MSELKLSEYLINRFAIFNKDKPLKSEAKLVQMAESLEKRVKELEKIIKEGNELASRIRQRAFDL